VQVAGRQESFTVAAACALSDRFQSRHRPIHNRKIYVDAGLDNLSADQTTSLPRVQAPSNISQHTAAMFRAHRGAQVQRSRIVNRDRVPKILCVLLEVVDGEYLLVRAHDLLCQTGPERGRLITGWRGHLWPMDGNPPQALPQRYHLIGWDDLEWLRGEAPEICAPEIAPVEGWLCRGRHDDGDPIVARQFVENVENRFEQVRRKTLDLVQD
jgi:hypothetical protein